MKGRIILGVLLLIIALFFFYISFKTYNEIDNTTLGLMANIEAQCTKKSAVQKSILGVMFFIGSVLVLLRKNSDEPEEQSNDKNNNALQSEENKLTEEQIYNNGICPECGEGITKSQDRCYECDTNLTRYM